MNCPEPLVSRYVLTITDADTPSAPIVLTVSGHNLATRLPWLASLVGTVFYTDTTIGTSRFQVEPVIDDAPPPVQPRKPRQLASVR